MPLSQALSHPVPVVVQIPTYLLTPLKQKGSGPGVGRCHLGKAPHTQPSTLPPGSQMSWDLNVCCRDLPLGLWVQLLCFDTPHPPPPSPAAAKACRKINQCPDQVFSGLPGKGFTVFEKSGVSPVFCRSPNPAQPSQTQTQSSQGLLCQGRC